MKTEIVIWRANPATQARTSGLHVITFDDKDIVSPDGKYVAYERLERKPYRWTLYSGYLHQYLKKRNGDFLVPLKNNA
jgi:hypothetical protein